ncbi:MAG: NYN domain-containing protein [Rhodobacteraceae bacterium]|nr:NYN domain-containing protein [Paracoccaceae bacterium]MCF8513357.1 NYN domain-containing protein [Paracoccaceae bacterium]MCF8517743.1 NYN domain-containing protein [Paracoccaceae bacterium]
MTRPVIALIDADNIAATHAAKILGIATSLGRVDVRRCYLNAKKATEWLCQSDFRAIHAGCGKNGADILMAMDAMEFAIGGQSLAFVLASSDSDFSHLAHRLRERGHTVHGVGEAKTLAPFRAACSTFTQIGPSSTAIPAPKPPASFKPPLAAGELEKTIRSVIAQHSKNGKGMLLTEFYPKMHQQHGVRISSYPEKTWRAFFLARMQQFDIDPRGTDAYVRCRPAGFVAPEAVTGRA